MQKLTALRAVGGSDGGADGRAGDSGVVTGAGESEVVDGE
jgi:hypothetical protein